MGGSNVCDHNPYAIDNCIADGDSLISGGGLGDARAYTTSVDDNDNDGAAGADPDPWLPLPCFGFFRADGSSAEDDGTAGGVAAAADGVVDKPSNGVFRLRV